MAEVINLRRARKARNRVATERQAAENRVRFGQTRTTRSAAERIEEQRNRLLDGAKRED